MSRHDDDLDGPDVAVIFLSLLVLGAWIAFVLVFLVLGLIEFVRAIF